MTYFFCRILGVLLIRSRGNGFEAVCACFSDLSIGTTSPRDLFPTGRNGDSSMMLWSHLTNGLDGFSRVSARFHPRPVHRKVTGIRHPDLHGSAIWRHENHRPFPPRRRRSSWHQLLCSRACRPWFHRRRHQHTHRRTWRRSALLMLRIPGSPTGQSAGTAALDRMMRSRHHARCAGFLMVGSATGCPTRTTRNGVAIIACCEPAHAVPDFRPCR